MSEKNYHKYTFTRLNHVEQRKDRKTILREDAKWINRHGTAVINAKMVLNKWHVFGVQCIFKCFNCIYHVYVWLSVVIFVNVLKQFVPHEHTRCPWQNKNTETTRKSIISIFIDQDILWCNLLTWSSVRTMMWLMTMLTALPKLASRYNLATWHQTKHSDMQLAYSNKYTPQIYPTKSLHYHHHHYHKGV